MKKRSILSVVVLVVAMMVGFVGCGGSGSPVVTIWENSQSGKSLVAYSDNTWDFISTQAGISSTIAKGTYTGDATKDGDLKVKVTHKVDENSQSLKELATPSEYTATISGKTLKVPNALFSDGAPGTIDFTRK